MTLVEPPVKRRYDASRRREAAAHTRQAIMDAALELFTDRGYAATPMTAVAKRAGVALDTVYAAVGRKSRAGPAADRDCDLRWQSGRPGRAT